MFHWLKVAVSRNQNPNAGQRRRIQPHVEELEDRVLPSTASFLAPFTPQQIRHAYGFDQVNADGTGQTIAIIDAYYDPTITSDIANFSSAFNLPQMDGKGSNPTFTQLDLSNHTLSPTGDDWTIETALDVEWAHAIAPKANILLVEAASDGINKAGTAVDLLNAVDVARNTPGVVAVSISWGQNEWAGETNLDSHFTTPAGHTGVTFVAASGDAGAPSIWPALSTNVVSVGGTTLTLNKLTGAYSGETAWGAGYLSSLYGGSGGGFSQYEAKPSYQSNVTQSGVHRTGPDISFDADPNTGYYVLDQTIGGWYQVGGTSAGAPQAAATIALVDQLRGAAGSLDGATQTLPALYSVSSADFHDITTGNNHYPAGPGYDLVTGRGSPIANLLIPDLVKTGAPVALRIITTNPGAAPTATAVRPSHFSIVMDAINPGEADASNPAAAHADLMHPASAVTAAASGVQVGTMFSNSFMVPTRPASPAPGGTALILDVRVDAAGVRSLSPVHLTAQSPHPDSAVEPFERDESTIDLEMPFAPSTLLIDNAMPVIEEFLPPAPPLGTAAWRGSVDEVFVQDHGSMGSSERLTAPAVESETVSGPALAATAAVMALALGVQPRDARARARRLFQKQASRGR